VIVGLTKAARVVGCSVTQLRWLERRRLIPQPRRDRHGRRTYNDQELLAIAQLLELKEWLRGSSRAAAKPDRELVATR